PHQGLGNYQRLGDGNTLHYFGHLSQFVMTSGSIAAGQIVAEMGSSGCSTGTHLHWIVYQNSNLIDPAMWAGPGPSG
ncbi:MAG: M23 family metallopeptidase, partial [Chloroflexi bacterium]|nr:M23 family metallopeptidase [Chloroflexota bacterium]